VSTSLLLQVVDVKVSPTGDLVRRQGAVAKVKKLVLKAGQGRQ